MSSFLRAATGAALAGALLAPLHTQAQTVPTTTTAAPTDQPQELPPVVVTATRSQRTIADQPLSVTVVERRQIEDTPAQSLDDVLRTVPGVNVPLAASYQLHPTAGSVSMRGLGGIRALVMLDGVPLNDPFFGYVQWNRVPLENIERVEVVRGGGASLWGNYAMGGVINIITRRPDKQAFGVEGGYGSYNTYRSNAFTDVPISESVTLRMNGNLWGTGGYNQIQPAFGPIYVPTSFNAVNGAATLYVKPDDTLSGYVRFNYHSNAQTLQSRDSTNNQEIYDLTSTFTKRFGQSEVTLTAFHERSRFVTNNPGTPDGVATGFGEFVQNAHTTPVFATGGSLQGSTRLSDTFRLLTIGADFQQIEGSDTALIYDQTGALIRTDIGRGKQRFVGIFGQVDVFPLENLEILLSGRYQTYRNFSGFDGNPGGLGAVPDSNTDSFDPRVSARWGVAQNFALRAAAYTAFRAPTLDNLYRGFSVPFGVFLPNAQLQPERLRGIEGGFDVNWRSVTAQFTAYTSEVTNLLTTRNLAAGELPAGFFFGSVNINAGKAIVQGLEATVEWEIVQGLKAALSYTTVSSKIVENAVDPASIGNQQAGIPTQQASAGLSYADPRGWRIGGRLRWLGQSWGDNDHTLPIDSHTVVDASLGYAFTPPAFGSAQTQAKSAEVFVDIQNLFNSYYIADNSGFNPPLQGTPFTVFAGLRARF